MCSGPPRPPLLPRRLALVRLSRVSSPGRLRAAADIKRKIGAAPRCALDRRPHSTLATTIAAFRDRLSHLQTRPEQRPLHRPSDRGYCRCGMPYVERQAQLPEQDGSRDDARAGQVRLPYVVGNRALAREGSQLIAARFALGAGAGNRRAAALASAPRVAPARAIKGGDIPAMKALWGKDDATKTKHLRSLGPAKAWEAIDAFCRSRADGKRKDPPTVQEVMDRLSLTAQDVQPQQRAARVVEGMALDLPLIDTPTIAVGLDSHQNKHQSRVLMALGQYSGGKAGKGEKGG